MPKELQTMWSMCACVMKKKFCETACSRQWPISKATFIAGIITHVSWPPTETPSIENPWISNAPVLDLPSFVWPSPWSASFDADAETWLSCSTWRSWSGLHRVSCVSLPSSGRQRKYQKTPKPREFKSLEDNTK